MDVPRLGLILPPPAMSTLPQTTTLLLAQIADFGQTEAWETFDRRYRPVLTALGRSLGLNDADAADMAQTTLADMAVALRAGQYDRAKGRLRSWILGIARHRAARLLDLRKSRREVGLLADLDQISDDALTDLWLAARQKTIVEAALTQLRTQSRFEASTLLAFELSTLRGVPPGEAAVLAGLDGAEDVYIARHRVTRRLREIAVELEPLYDEGPP